jgi:hypothetical protein
MVNKTINNNKQVKELGKELSQLVKGIKAEMQALKDLSGESITLEDHQNGLTFNAVSHKFDAVELTRFGLDSFKLMTAEKLKGIPIGVN